MKASEAIVKLAEIITKRGDFELYYWGEFSAGDIRLILVDEIKLTSNFNQSKDLLPGEWYIELSG